MPLLSTPPLNSTCPTAGKAKKFAANSSRATLIGSLATKVPVTGSYSSLSATGCPLLVPPAIKTLPLYGRVSPTWPLRGVIICAVSVVKEAVAGSYASAVSRSAPVASWPPSISTVPSKSSSSDAVASVRASLRLPVSVTLPLTGLKISALVSGPGAIGAARDQHGAIVEQRRGMILPGVLQLAPPP